jgi:hypothetical protein
MSVSGIEWPGDYHPRAPREPIPPAPKQKVWVATVSDDNDSPGPAVYVSDTDENLIKVMREQQGIPDDEDILEWFEANGKVAVWDSYYVE